MDRLQPLTDAGVSIWLDDLGRQRLSTGSVAGLVRDRHVSGTTTVPQQTLIAVADADIPTDSIRAHYADAQRILDDLADVGIDFDDVITTLEHDAVEKPSGSCDELTDALRPALGSG